MHRSAVFWFVVALCGGTAALAKGPADPIPSLHAARVAAAEQVYADTVSARRMGMETVDEVYLWSARWTGAARDAGIPEAANAHLIRMLALKTEVDAQVPLGVATPREAAAVDYYVAEARVWAVAP